MSEAKKSTLGGEEHDFLSGYGYRTGCPNLMWRGLWLFYHKPEAQAQWDTHADLSMTNRNWSEVLRNEPPQLDINARFNPRNGRFPILFLSTLRMRFLCGRALVEQWRELSPPTNVARDQITASTLYVGWVRFWFSPLLREDFSPVLRFCPLLKNQHSTRNTVDEELLTGYATAGFPFSR